MSKDVLNNLICDDALCRVAAGDNDALAVIYSRMGRRIFALALSIVREPHTAEDIMQDTFVRLAAQAHTYRKGSNAVAFILTVTRNLSLNVLSHRQFEVPVEITENDGGAEPDERPLPALEALSLLDEDERQLVVLRLDGNMSFANLGKLTGISPDACRKRYRRALDKLKPYYNN